MSITSAVSRMAELEALMGRLGGSTPVASAGGFDAQLQQASAAQDVSATTAGAGAGDAPYGSLIGAAASKYDVDPALLRGLIRAESNFNPNAGSPAGAQGLTQLMPGTAASLGVKNLHDPAQSIDGGAHYLRMQLDAFGGDVTKALAAYNAGPGAVQRHGGVPPYAETQQYVQKVLGYAAEYRTSTPVAATATTPVTATAAAVGGPLSTPIIT
jgi:soluble lytic murein transglycosylase-like protein